MRPGIRVGLLSRSEPDRSSVLGWHVDAIWKPQGTGKIWSFVIGVVLPVCAQSGRTAKASVARTRVMKCIIPQNPISAKLDPTGKIIQKRKDTSISP